MSNVIAILIVIVFFLAVKYCNLNIRWVMKHKRIFLLISIVILLIILSFVYRYSIVAFYLLMANGHGVFDSLQRSLTMSNDITLAIGVAEMIIEEQGLNSPEIYSLIDSLKEAINKSYGDLGTASDLFKLIDLLN
ncbi:MAG: hypothetical protein JEZ08_22310 [Clostridiales bacterium]|nr:hypothetical protein [Clostridiales bacterium]